MAFVTADRVRDTSTTAGSGSFSVSGTAPTGYRTFSAVLSVSDTFYYSIQHQTLNEWEVGLGTYSSANTFARTTVYSSSNAGSAVTFSAGTKDVFITMAAARSLQLDASGNVTPSINGTLAWQAVQTGDFTAVAGNAYPVNTTSGAVTVTLPASPSAGQQIIITDYAGTFATNNCTLNSNGNKINAATGNVLLNFSSESIALVYIDSTRGWIPYSGFQSSPLVYSASYLIVAGGGGSGGDIGGGGGAGGLLSGTTNLTAGTSYTITVGAGGAGATGSNPGVSGSNSVFSSFTSVGGGGGAKNAGVAGSGGSGGGGGWATPSAPTAGGSGTSGQGFAGGTGGATNPGSSGGGGGSSAVGAAGKNGSTGAGGAGTSSSITGSSVTYAGGGGGGGYNVSGGAGGSGGGGTGGRVNDPGTVISSPTAGTANTGGGGGGGGAYAQNGTAGGSGVAIISIPTANYTGVTTGSPTVTTSGSNTIIKFTASGSYTA